MNISKTSVLGWVKIGITVLSIVAAILSGDWKTAITILAGAGGLNSVLSGAGLIKAQDASPN